MSLRRKNQSIESFDVFKWFLCKANSEKLYVKKCNCNAGLAYLCQLSNFYVVFSDLYVYLSDIHFEFDCYRTIISCPFRLN